MNCSPTKFLWSRFVAGVGFLVLAGGLATRRAPGRVALWPAALVPTWFGISHLVAGVIGYRGCPELGAIPSVMLGREVPTACGPWERVDRALGSRSFFGYGRNLLNKPVPG